MLVRIVSLQIPDDGVNTEETSPEKDLTSRKINKVAVFIVIVLESLINWFFNNSLRAGWCNSIFENDIRNGRSFTI